MLMDSSLVRRFLGSIISHPLYGPFFLLSASWPVSSRVIFLLFFDERKWRKAAVYQLKTFGP